MSRTESVQYDAKVVVLRWGATTRDMDRLELANANLVITEDGRILKSRWSRNTQAESPSLIKRLRKKVHDATA